MKPSLYKQAVTWIAANDEPTFMLPIEMADLISVCLVADLWNRTPGEVAIDVIIERKKAARK